VEMNIVKIGRIAKKNEYILYVTSKVKKIWNIYIGIQYVKRDIFGTEGESLYHI
jgi:hypothetical protein